MNVLIVIIAYVLSVFLNRWINKIGNRITDTDERHVIGWFFSFIYTIVIILVILLVYDKRESKFTRWFKGRHWD